MSYISAVRTYLKLNYSRQKDYFKFLADNPRINSEELSQRFLEAEYVQAQCKHFKVNP